MESLRSVDLLTATEIFRVKFNLNFRVQNRGSYCSLLAVLHRQLLFKLLCWSQGRRMGSKVWRGPQKLIVSIILKSSGASETAYAQGLEFRARVLTAPQKKNHLQIVTIAQTHPLNILCPVSNWANKLANPSKTLHRIKWFTILRRTCEREWTAQYRENRRKLRELLWLNSTCICPAG